MAITYRQGCFVIAGTFLAVSVVMILSQIGVSDDSKSGRELPDSRVRFQAEPRKMWETEQNSRRLQEASERFEKIEITKLLNALEDLNHGAGLNRCGRLLKEELERTRDYPSVGKFLATLPKSDAKRLLTEWIIGTATSAGPAGDFDEQKRLIEDLELSNELRLSDRLYREAGGRAFPELARRNAGDLDKARWLEMALKGSASSNGVKKTVEVLPDLIIDEEAGLSARRGAEWLLASNSTETSVAIGELPSGYPKDMMIEAMVGWLERKGETASIGTWIGLVSDPAVKERLQRNNSE